MNINEKILTTFIKTLGGEIVVESWLPPGIFHKGDLWENSEGIWEVDNVMHTTVSYVVGGGGMSESRAETTAQTRVYISKWKSQPEQQTESTLQ